MSAGSTAAVVEQLPSSSSGLLLERRGSDQLHSSSSAVVHHDHQQQRQITMFYSQRITLLGAVTSTVGALLAQEASERRVLIRSFNSNSAAALRVREAGGDAHMHPGEERHDDDDAMDGGGFVPFDPLRVNINRIVVMEHEDRWELVHGEHDLHKAMLQEHEEEVYRLTTENRRQRATERAVLERESTLRLLEIVCHWEMQRAAIDEHEACRRKAAEVVTRQRQELFASEAEGREVTSLSEDVLYRQEYRKLHLLLQSSLIMP